MIAVSAGVLCIQKCPTKTSRNVLAIAKNGVYMNKNPKSKRSDAERASEWYAHEIEGCVITRRAVASRFHKVDFFGADVMGFRKNGEKVFIQVTAGQSQAVSARRKKLEKTPWHPTDTVLLLQLRSTEDPANARRKLWFFRVHRYYTNSKIDGPVKVWSTDPEACVVPKEWFRAYKK